MSCGYSAATMEGFAVWEAFDDALDTYCFLPEEDTEAEYVDLLLNPERYTGYRGKSANRIWHTIYLENCFRYYYCYCDLIFVLVNAIIV